MISNCNKVLRLFAVAVATILSVILTRRPEPSYQGRSLTEWLWVYRENWIQTRINADFSSIGGQQAHSVQAVRDQREVARNEKERQRAADAVRHIGTNALPYLLVRLHYDPSPLKQKMESILRFIGFGPSGSLERSYRDSDAAVLGFEILGPVATSTIPELERFVCNSPSDRCASHAVAALTYIGRESIPSLITLLTNDKLPAVRKIAAVADIPALGTNSSPAVPYLIRLLKDPNPVLREVVAQTLGLKQAC